MTNQVLVSVSVSNNDDHNKSIALVPLLQRKGFFETFLNFQVKCNPHDDEVKGLSRNHGQGPEVVKKGTCI